MVSAIGTASTASAGFTSGTSTAGIEAQITRYKKELSDCVNCQSANTPEGKADIQRISNKISTAEARIESMITTQQRNPPSAVASAATSSPSEAGSLNKPVDVRSVNTPAATGAISSPTTASTNINPDVSRTRAINNVASSNTLNPDLTKQVGRTPDSESFRTPPDFTYSFDSTKPPSSPYSSSTGSLISVVA